MATRMQLSGAFSTLIFRTKSVEYFQTIFHFYTPLKKSENWRFFYVFRGYGSGILVENGLSSFACGCYWWSIYFEIFVVWQSIELTTGLLGFPSLWTLRNVLNCIFFFFASELNKSFAIFSWKRYDALNSSIILLP